MQKWDESKWKNETKQAKSTKTSQKASEVEDLHNPETKAAERRIGQQRSPKVYWKFISLPNHGGNQQPNWV